MHPVAGGGVQYEAAPATTDVEDALTLLQAQLLADQLALGQLCILERVRASRKDGAAIGHRGVEEQLEKLVGHVVVVAHGALVTLPAVATTARAKLAGGDSRRTRQATCAHRGQSQARTRRAVDRGRLERVEQRDHAIEIVGLELTRRVCPAQTQLSGSAQQVRDRGGRVHRQYRAARDRGGQLRAVPEAQGKRARGESTLELAAQRLRLGEQRSGHLVCSLGSLWYADARMTEPA